MERYYLNVPYASKDEAKCLGAKWDWERKSWYFTDEKDKDLFEKWIPKQTLSVEELSEEQQLMIQYAKEGHNVLVDACIGSGKTTTIQVLCNELKEKRILYLTYNRLLKMDAREKIFGKDVVVTNYHGFAWKVLKDAGISCGKGQLIQAFLNNVDTLNIPSFDLMVLDEYQDIDTEISEMLWILKQRNPGIQIVVVGDMAQKILNKTTLDVLPFMKRLLGEHRFVTFTKCFRISNELAKWLGSVWGKKINGVNRDCEVSIMEEDEVFRFLSRTEPKDVLCLGNRSGVMMKMLNRLEDAYPERYNKNTVYASIKDEDGDISVEKHNAIFTTYDGSKGLERRFCFVFNFTEDNWDVRSNAQDSDTEILKNVFCVAASRGKEKIVFVKKEGSRFVDRDYILNDDLRNKKDTQKFNASDMFSFKYVEEVEKCFHLLQVTKIKSEDNRVIDIKSMDGLIDLSPCIGIYQEAVFFKNYSIEDEINYTQKATCKVDRDRLLQSLRLKRNSSLLEKILYLSAFSTKQMRYFTQVPENFISTQESKLIMDRLGKEFSRNALVQVTTKKSFKKKGKRVVIDGRADVVKNDCVYELKFVSELTHEHFLQCAFYVASLGLKKGILWNVRTNEKYEIRIPDEKVFFKQVLYTITKGWFFK